MEFNTVQLAVFKNLCEDEFELRKNPDVSMDVGAYMKGTGRYQKMYDFLMGMTKSVKKDRHAKILYKFTKIYRDGHKRCFASVVDKYVDHLDYIIQWFEENEDVVSAECDGFVSWMEDMLEWDGPSSDDGDSDSDDYDDYDDSEDCEDDDEDDDDEDDDDEDDDDEDDDDEDGSDASDADLDIEGYETYCVGQDPAMDQFMDCVIEWVVDRLWNRLSAKNVFRQKRHRMSDD
jgi:hypothetical protein